MSQELERKVYLGEVIEEIGSAKIVLSSELAASLARFRASVDQTKLALAASFMAGVAHAYEPALRALSTRETIDQEGQPINHDSHK